MLRINLLTEYSIGSLFLDLGLSFNREQLYVDFVEPAISHDPSLQTLSNNRSD